MKENSKYLYCINCDEIQLCDETYVEEETNIRGFNVKEKYPKYFCTKCNNEVYDKLAFNYMISSSHDQMVCQVRDTYRKKIDKLKDELVKDRMEQFDDYVIYLLTKYIDMIEE